MCCSSHTHTVAALCAHCRRTHCRRTVAAAHTLTVAAHTLSLSPHCTLMGHAAPNSRTPLQPGKQRLEAHPGQDRPPLNSARAKTSSAAGRHASIQLYTCATRAAARRAGWRLRDKYLALHGTLSGPLATNDYKAVKYRFGMVVWCTPLGEADCNVLSYASFRSGSYPILRSVPPVVPLLLG